MAWGKPEKESNSSEKWTRQFDSRDKFDNFKRMGNNSDTSKIKKETSPAPVKTENLNATKGQDEVTDERNMETAENEGPSTKESSRNEGMKMSKEYQQDEKPEDSSSKKQTHFPISSKVKSLFQKYPYLFKNLELALNEKKSLFQDEELFLDSGSFPSFVVKYVENSKVSIVDHKPKEQAYLQANLKEWKIFIDSILNKSCVVFTDEDLSKTYICCSPELNVGLIRAQISKFLDQNPVVVKISSHVMEFMKLNEELSDLEPMEKDKAGNYNCSMKILRLTQLKEEMKKVTCQSYLLNESQYELLSEEKKDVLVDVDNKFHVKGNVYQYERIADIPVVFQVNPLTSISCVVSTDPESIPLDSLISIDWQQPKGDFRTIWLDKKENCRILEQESWNIPMNNHIVISAPGIVKQNIYSWNVIMEHCLESVKNDSVSHTIGISIPAEISESLVKFSENILTVVQNLPQNHDRPIYILLLVKTEKMKLEFVTILKKISDSKPDVHSSQEISSSAANDQCTVDVIKGLITEIAVDVIVCAVNQYINLAIGAVSKAILKKAGKKIQDECSKKYPNGITFPELATMPGYNLPCKYIFFGALPNNDKKPNISTFVEACLEKASDIGVSSIAFPALGTGNLRYEPREVAAQMASVIAKFKAKTRPSSLKEIQIVIYQDTKEMDPFFELKNKFAKSKDSKGAIPKIRPESSHPIEQNKWNLKYIYNPLQWVQFLNYSANRETLDEAINHFEKRLMNVCITVSVDEAQELFFFYDLISLVPDIVLQLESMQDSLLVPTHSADQFQRYLDEFRTQYCADVFLIRSEMKISHVEKYLAKIHQKYPSIICEIVSNKKDVLFRGPNFDLIQAAKYQLESFFGLRENVSVSQDRFNITKTESASSSGALPSYHQQKEVRNESLNISYQSTLATDSQNNKDTQDTDCFTIEDGFLVKVYHRNILTANVEGIVNAANKHLMHGAGLAYAIIKAAGDVVNKEGQDKLRDQPLNDGDVLSTSAGNLKQYKRIIHAVGPMRTRTNTDEYCRKKIAEAVCNSLKEASQLGLSSVAIPAISSAIFAVPIDVCTDGYFKGVMEFCKTRSPSCQLKEVHFVDLNPTTINAIKNHFARQLKTAGNNILQPKQNSIKLPKEENPTNITRNNKEKCPVCFEESPNMNHLKCNHICCLDCVTKLSPPKCCPTCRIPLDIVYGDQPNGTMRVSKSYVPLPGYDQNGTYEICYMMSTKDDTIRKLAYLPMSKKGSSIMKMLQLAFERRLIFTVGDSRTRSSQNITWNGIFHKTEKMNTSHNCDGYPDPNYFARVIQELDDKGITSDLVSNRNIKCVITIGPENDVTSVDLI